MEGDCPQLIIGALMTPQGYVIVKAMEDNTLREEQDDLEKLFTQKFILCIIVEEYDFKTTTQFLSLIINPYKAQFQKFYHVY